MNLLEAREQRSHIIYDYLKDYSVVVSVKTNVPGTNKNSMDCIRVLYVINNQLKQLFPFHKVVKHPSEDGNFTLYLFNQTEALALKEITVHLEETHPLGRFVDIDVYTPQGPISRRDIGLKKRKCMLCDEDAFFCMQNHAHTTKELLQKLKVDVQSFFNKTLTNRLLESFSLELDLHPKFGLVTPYSKGSHSDMDYQLMKKSYPVVVPYLIKMYEKGFKTKDIDQGFKEIRLIGIQAEKAMLQKSKGVNTYKGAIFLNGLLVYALGYYHQTLSKDVREIIKYISRNILSELKDDPNTFGIEAYQKYNVYTVRHEAYYGMPSVFKAVMHLSRYKKLDEKSLTMTLIHIISNKNDTVGLKRAKTFPKYYEIADLIEHIKSYDIDKINEITNLCIQHNISFGGSADVLIATLLIYHLQKDGLL